MLRVFNSSGSSGPAGDSQKRSRQEAPDPMGRTANTNPLAFVCRALPIRHFLRRDSVRQKQWQSVGAPTNRCRYWFIRCREKHWYRMPAALSPNTTFAGRTPRLSFLIGEMARSPNDAKSRKSTSTVEGGKQVALRSSIGQRQS